MNIFLVGFTNVMTKKTSNWIVHLEKIHKDQQFQKKIEGHMYEIKIKVLAIFLFLNS